MLTAQDKFITSFTITGFQQPIVAPHSGAVTAADAINFGEGEFVITSVPMLTDPLITHPVIMEDGLEKIDPTALGASLRNPIAERHYTTPHAMQHSQYPALEAAALHRYGRLEDERGQGEHFFSHAVLEVMSLGGAHSLTSIVSTIFDGWLVDGGRNIVHDLSRKSLINGAGRNALWPARVEIDPWAVPALGVAQRLNHQVVHEMYGLLAMPHLAPDLPIELPALDALHGVSSMALSMLIETVSVSSFPATAFHNQLRMRSTFSCEARPMATEAPARSARAAPTASSSSPTRRRSSPISVCWRVTVAPEVSFSSRSCSRELCSRRCISRRARMADCTVLPMY